MDLTAVLTDDDSTDGTTAAVQVEFRELTDLSSDMGPGMAAGLVSNLSTNAYHIMNLLIAYQGQEAEDHPGKFAGFEHAVQQGTLQRHSSMFWKRNRTANEWARFWDELIERVGAERIDWVLLHHFHDCKIMLGDALVRLRKIHPQVRIAGIRLYRGTRRH